MKLKTTEYLKKKYESDNAVNRAKTVYKSYGLDLDALLEYQNNVKAYHGCITFKGRVDKPKDLPIPANVGDAYICDYDVHLYVYDGNKYTIME